MEGRARPELGRGPADRTRPRASLPPVGPAPAACAHLFSPCIVQTGRRCDSIPNRMMGTEFGTSDLLGLGLSHVAGNAVKDLPAAGCRSGDEDLPDQIEPHFVEHYFAAVQATSHGNLTTE